MRFFGKIIGGGLGWALGGPLGMVIGAAIGHAMDGAQVNVNQSVYGHRHNTQAGDFNMSLLVLSAAVMKADGKVLKSELNFIKQFYNRQFNNPEFTQQQMLILKDILQKEIPLREVCEQIRYNMKHPLRLELVHYLFGISQADGHVDKTEVDMIKRIAQYMSISQVDFESIKAMFYKDSGAAYKILELEASASDDDVKKAYRKMAMKYHPDRISSLGEQHENHAKEKFQKVQEAYEIIKKERGFN